MLALWLKPRKLRISKALFIAFSFFSPKTRIGASIIFSKTDLCGNKLKLWKTRPTSFLIILAVFLSQYFPSLQRVFPEISILPSSHFSSPVIILSKVVFPPPDGPTTTTISPSKYLNQHL